MEAPHDIIISLKYFLVFNIDVNQDKTTQRHVSILE